MMASIFFMRSGADANNGRGSVNRNLESVQNFRQIFLSTGLTKCIRAVLTKQNAAPALTAKLRSVRTQHRDLLAMPQQAAGLQVTLKASFMPCFLRPRDGKADIRLESQSYA